VSEPPYGRSMTRVRIGGGEVGSQAVTAEGEQSA